jgi:hypothetical protein
LEHAVTRRVSVADLKGFKKVVATLEQEAHRRCGSRDSRPDRIRKKITS